MNRTNLILINSRRNLVFLLLFVFGILTLTVLSLDESQFRPNLISTANGLSLKIFYLFITIGCGVYVSTGFLGKLLTNGMTRMQYLRFRLFHMAIFAVVFHIITFGSSVILASKYSILSDELSYYAILPLCAYFLYGIIALIVGHLFDNLVVTIIVAYLLPDLEKIIFVVFPRLAEEPNVYFAPHVMNQALMEGEISNYGSYFISFMIFSVIGVLLFRSQIQRREL